MDYEKTKKEQMVYLSYYDMHDTNKNRKFK